MTKRFLIAADGLTKAAEKELITYFREIGVGWWHHVTNLWLVVDTSDAADVIGLRSKIKELRTKDTGVCLVMQIDEDITWAGLHPIGSTKRTAFEWLKGSWTNG